MAAQAARHDIAPRTRWYSLDTMNDLARLTAWHLLQFGMRRYGRRSELFVCDVNATLKGISSSTTLKGG
jgi:hypothetical protein